MFKQRWVDAARSGLLLAMLGTLACGGLMAQPVPDGSTQPIAHKDSFVDPLDASAVMRPNVTGQPLMAMARAGSRLVTVGMRGLIALSDDDGKTWLQMASPVQTDLLALSFPTPTEGWAVGHSGVVLHTSDAGKTWTKQLDGREAASSLMDYYKARIDAGDKTLQPYFDQLTLNYKQGPSLPFLSVLFKDPRHGMAVGAFGMAIATKDGGRTWQPILERIDNPQFLHLNAIGEIAGDVYLAGEQGTIFKLDPASEKFVRIQTDYAGSFFGVAGSQDALIAYGLRGTTYQSADHGTTWKKLDSPLHGAVTGAVYDASGKTFALVTSAGEVARTDPATGTFVSLPRARPIPLTGLIVAADHALVVSGLDGPGIVALH